MAPPVTGMAGWAFLLAASLLLGTTAHTGAAGAATLSPEPLIVVGLLMALAAAGVVGAGALLARLAPHGWGRPIRDGSAGAALVIAQLLVHWLTPSAISPAGNAEHLGHPGGMAGMPLTAGMTPGESTAIAHAHGGPTAMVLAHTTAMLMVAVMLRWAQASSAALAAATASLVRAFRAGLNPRAARPGPPVAGRRLRVLPGWPVGPKLSLDALAATLVRRGPPVSPA